MRSEGHEKNHEDAEIRSPPPTWATNVDVVAQFSGENPDEISVGKVMNS